MAADADERAWLNRLGCLGEIDNLGHVGKVVAGECDKVRAPIHDCTAIGGMAVDLQVDELNRVPGASSGRRYQFET